MRGKYIACRLKNSEKHALIEAISAQYGELSEQCKTEFLKRSNILTAEKGARLVTEGQFSNKAYFIVSGSSRAFYLKEGRDITDWFAFENDFICAINSFFLGIPSPHFIETLEPSVLLEVSREDSNVLSDAYRDFDRLTKAVITKTMLQQQHRIVSLQFENALQRYEGLLKLRPDIVQRVPLTHIASFLGITLETLSRVRNPRNRI